MNDSYADTIEKLQAQGLEALKQAQAAQIAAVSSIREMLGNATGTIPGGEALKNIPSVIAKVSELNSAFAVKLIEQQNNYVNELVSVLKSARAEPETETPAQGTADQT